MVPMNQAVADKLVRRFIAGAVLILVMTALAKALAASGEARVLARPDPLLGMLSNRQIMLIAVVLELLVIGLIMREMDRLRQVALIAWIGTVFLAYRLGLWWIGHEGACPCLGNVTYSIGLSPAMEDLGVKVLLGYLLLGSYSIVALELVGRWKHKRCGLPATT
jgi:hypothetical protein